MFPSKKKIQNLEHFLITNIDSLIKFDFVFKIA